MNKFEKAKADRIKENGMLADAELGIEQGNKYSKVDIKNEIVGIAVMLPYASSKKDADDGVRDIMKLLEQL